MADAKPELASAVWADEAAFKTHFDRSPFHLEHSLSGSPLFELPRLLRLAKLLKRDLHNVVFDCGHINVEDRWDKRPPTNFTLEQAMESIEGSRSWVILKHTELDPEFRELMDQVMSDLCRLSGRNLRKETKNLEAQVMLTSPGRVTPYHIDNECNVLFQIRGEKDIYIFDQNNREILTEEELERFWVGDWNAGEYKARCQDQSRGFRLSPGKGVHIPVNAPHWVKNSTNVSISLSINFEWKNERAYNVYRANYFLRRVGMHPQAPGGSTTGDAMKNAFGAFGFVPLRAAARSGVRFLRRLRQRSRESVLKGSSVA